MTSTITGRLPEKSTNAFSPARCTWRIVGVRCGPSDGSAGRTGDSPRDAAEGTRVKPLQGHAGPIELLVDPRPCRAEAAARPPRRGRAGTAGLPVGRRPTRAAGARSGLPAGARRPYSDTVPNPTPQARAIARWDRRCSYFSRRTSRTCLIGSVSVMFVGALLPRGPSYRAGCATDERSGSESDITIPGTGDHDGPEPSPRATGVPLNPIHGCSEPRVFCATPPCALALPRG